MPTCCVLWNVSLFRLPCVAQEAFLPVYAVQLSAAHLKGHPLCSSYAAMLLKRWSTTPLAEKNSYSREIHEVDLQFNHVISSCSSTSMQLAVSACREMALQIEVNVAWYLMIALWMNLIGFNDFFLARVVYGIPQIRYKPVFFVSGNFFFISNCSFLFNWCRLASTVQIAQEHVHAVQTASLAVDLTARAFVRLDGQVRIFDCCLCVEKHGIRVRVCAPLSVRVCLCWPN